MIVQAMLPVQPGDKFGVVLLKPEGFEPDRQDAAHLRGAVGDLYPFDQDMPPGMTYSTTKLRDGRVVVWHLVPLPDTKDRRLN